MDHCHYQMLYNCLDRMMSRSHHRASLDSDSANFTDIKSHDIIIINNNDNSTEVSNILQQSHQDKTGHQVHLYHVELQ